MRIVQVLPSLEGGEVALTALEFAQELVKQGHESIVISAGGELVSRLQLHGSRHITLPLGQSSLLRNLIMKRRLRTHLKSLQPDVLHARGPYPARIARAAWKGLPDSQRPRLVTSIHEVPSRGLFRGRLSNRALAAGERVVAASGGLAAHLRQRFNSVLGEREPQVIYRGVNTRELDKNAPVSGLWHQKILNDYPQLEGKHWLLLPAKVAPGQGHERFLEMLAAISLERDDVFGVIVGEIPPGGEKFALRMERRAQQMGLSEKVLFLGARRDMREFYASARITFDLAQKPQSSGRIVTEALAMNCPVVCIKGRGAAAEVAELCFPQGVVEESSVEALVSAALSILSGAQPIRFAGFSLTETTQQALSLYEVLCGRDTPASGSL
ncbi:glycosyltransferase [Microbulbifer aggregans]|uniref:glycosyltransferase n=1 Tax=Microbulbifer aggregans TaxID=1769779 RepID=UPI001CFF4A0A|nr:glycosyltransferase [Microbulbifer aggregans]